MDGLGQGTILTSLKKLAAESKPGLHNVVSELIELTENELGDFIRIAEGRIFGIHSLEKLIADKDFKAPKNEEVLFRLFKRCPWLIDPTFFEFLTANQEEDSVFEDLARSLKLTGTHPASIQNPRSRRPGVRGE